MSAPILIIHRRNRTMQLNGLPRHCWVEIDIDLLEGVPCLSHDPVTREMSAEKLTEFLPRALERGIEGFVFDCKRENAEAAVHPLIEQHKIANYFYLNEMDVQADILMAKDASHRSAARIWQYRGARDVIRYVEDMKKDKQSRPAWAWIDCWQRGLPENMAQAAVPINQADARALQQIGVRLCVCSPELYAHSYDKKYEMAELEKIYSGIVRYRHRLLQTGVHFDAVCTKFPWLWTMDVDLLLSSRSLTAT